MARSPLNNYDKQIRNTISTNLRQLLEFKICCYILCPEIFNFFKNFLIFLKFLKKL